MGHDSDKFPDSTWEKPTDLIVLMIGLEIIRHYLWQYVI